MQRSENFYESVLNAIRKSLSEILGKSTATAVDFYVDPSIAIADIVRYTDLLKKFFGEGSKILEERIVQELYAKLGLEFQKKEGYRLSDYVLEAKNKYLA